MSTTFDHPNRTYIKSNAGTIMNLLWFVCGLLLLLVVGLCTFVILGHEKVGNYHWDANGHFFYTVNNNQATVVKYIDHDTKQVVLPTSVKLGGNEYAVTTIGDHAFTNSQITTIEIPDSVTEIKGDIVNRVGAFSGCVALQKIKLGQNVTRIGCYAFKNCVKLGNIDFPATMQFVDSGAFESCLELQSITLRGNTVLGDGCFSECLDVKQLILADSVRLTDNKPEVLADLAKLSQFEILGTESIYHVVSECLMTKTDTDNDTVVLGGYGAESPVGTKYVNDYAWGERAEGICFVPATVVSLGTNSFYEGSDVVICTDAATKPSGWLTTVKVYPQAKKVTFRSDLSDVDDVEGYVYLPSDPEYSDVFPDAQPVTPFKKWKEVGNVYTAEYQSVNKTDYDALDDVPNELSDAIINADSFLNDPETSQKFAIDFWEEFKVLTDQAKILQAQRHPYQYAVTELLAKLNPVLEKISTENTTVLVEDNWRVALQSLVNAVKQIEYKDTNLTAEQWEQLQMQMHEAEQLIQATWTMESTGENSLQQLSALFEKITVKTDASSPLGKEIATCYALHRTDYTVDTWQELQTALVAAEQVTSHNLSVSQIREQLVQKRAALRESTFTDYQNDLLTWLSICDDLSADDYLAIEYDKLKIKAVEVSRQFGDYLNNAELTEALTALQTMYHDLVPIDNNTEYQTEETSVWNRKSLPFFITAVVLFSGAVAAGAQAAALRKQLRQTQE